MEYEYKTLIVYIDEQENLIIFPTGESKKTRLTTILDLPFFLNNLNNDNELERILHLAFDKCFSVEPDDTEKRSPIEKFLNIKGYNKAVQGKRSILVEWDIYDGYSVTPTIKRKGFDHLINKKIIIGKDHSKGELAHAIRNAIKSSIP